jgi:hypothetical protein
MKESDFCNCLIITAIVSPKNKNSKASAYLETYPTIILKLL